MTIRFQTTLRGVRVAVESEVLPGGPGEPLEHFGRPCRAREPAEVEILGIDPEPDGPLTADEQYGLDCDAEDAAAAACR